MSVCALVLAVAIAGFGQSGTGELRVTVTDAAGLPLQSAVELVSEANQVRQHLETDRQGTLVARRLPFGIYRIVVARDGFANHADLVDLHSELPVDYRVTLNLAVLQTEVTVRAEETLLDSNQTTTVRRIGAEAIVQRSMSLPGRSLPDLVSTEPGWLLEANAILHPRGSEYQTQYVVDGLPLTDNRSPAFAPEIDADDVHAMSILTGGYPAEYGRKLGGVIDVVTAGATGQGFHGGFVASAGSFDTKGGDAVGGYGWRRTTLSGSAGVADTGRYLDPPVEENDTNHGTSTHAAVHLERDVTDRDRAGVIVRYGQAQFQVPNERLQQDAGQRQDRSSRETAAQVSYQHVFSARTLVDVRGLVRDVSAGLQSNEVSTPIRAAQDRGIREQYLKVAVAASAGAHEWKAGGDASWGTVRERFAYLITDPARFDADTPAAFDFGDRRADREQALFVQDRLRRGAWTVNAGVRWDRYRLVVDQNAVSPRLGVARAWPAADLVIRGSYDRAFQTPAVENLLLASSPAVDALSDSVVRLPVRPSIGNFYEAAIAKVLFGVVRVDASFYDRAMTNFADDDLLLNTGVSFPVAFSRADIRGTEIKIDVPHWRALSGFVSYAHMRGVGDLPIAGGLLLGGEAAGLQEPGTRFPVSQDQRHTWRGRVTYRPSPAAWVAFGASYGSGLPVEFRGDRVLAIEQYSQSIVDRVDFDAGRVRSMMSLDATAGLDIVGTSKTRVRLQTDVRNLANRLNLINFAGLFSGTAVGAPRSVGVRARVEFR